MNSRVTIPIQAVNSVLGAVSHVMRTVNSVMIRTMSSWMMRTVSSVMRTMSSVMRTISSGMMRTMSSRMMRTVNVTRTWHRLNYQVALVYVVSQQQYILILTAVGVPLLIWSSLIG